MATDIWIHIEYHSKKKNKFVYAYEADGERIYPVLGALAGTRSYIEPIYEPRGLPEDVSRETLKEFNDFGADAHTPSWLITQEFRNCLDLVLQELQKEGNNLKTVKEWLSPYEKIYDYMKSHEDDGEPCRIVFGLTIRIYMERLYI